MNSLLLLLLLGTCLARDSHSSKHSFLNSYSFPQMKHKLFGSAGPGPSPGFSSTEEPFTESFDQSSTFSSYFTPIQSLVDSWNYSKEQIIQWIIAYQQYPILLYYAILLGIIKFYLPQSLQFVSYLSIIYIFYFGHASFWDCLQILCQYRRTSFILFIIYTIRPCLTLLFYQCGIIHCIYQLPGIRKIRYVYLRHLPQEQLSISNKEWITAFSKKQINKSD